MQEVLLKARDGDIVRVNYVLSLKDGPVFSPSTEPLPFEVMIGRGTVLPAFENAVLGMREGEAKKITVTVEKSFACYFDEFIKVIERRTLPLDINPEVGMKLQVCTAGGAEIDGRVTEVDDLTIEIDADQEAAGKERIFEIRLLKIVRPC